MAALVPVIEELLFDDDYSCEKRYRNGDFILATMLIREDRVKIAHYVETVVPHYLPSDFKRFFRVSPETCELLCQSLGQHVQIETEGMPGRPPVRLEKQVLLTLWYLGSKDTTKQISDRFDLTESCMIRCRDRIMDLILTHLKRKFITWPTPQGRLQISNHLSQRHGFPGVIGCLDGSHIPIKAPKNKKEAHVNRKGYHSLVLQGVCREDLRFIHVFTGWPGSVHDARILRNSDLWEQGLNWCQVDKHLLGDGAYPVRRWLMTPFRDNGQLTQRQKRYNYCLSNLRQAIERSFGLLKSRFRRLTYIDVHHVVTAIKIIMTSTVIHNICILSNDDIEEVLANDACDVPNLGHFLGDLENDAEGALKRNNIAHVLAD